MKRLTIAILIGLIAGAVCATTESARYAPAGDLAWALDAARDLLTGRDPYARVLPPGGVPYPLPAALVVMPLAWLPDVWAAGVFAGLASALLAYGLLRTRGWPGLLLFAAFPYWHALRIVQWSPLLCAAWLLPHMAPVCLAKPHLGAPVVLSHPPSPPPSGGVGGWLACAAFGLISLVVLPMWPWSWLSQLGAYESFVPVAVLPFGPLLVLAALRWRDDRARLVLLMALMPQRGWYDVLPLFLVARSWRAVEPQYIAALLAVVSWLAPVAQAFGRFDGSPAWVVVTCYLPALLTVLLPECAGFPQRRHPCNRRSS